MTKKVLSSQDINRALTRIAHEIVERTGGAEQLVILGIPSRGVPLATEIASRLQQIEPSFDAAAQTGQLDITMYRDDLAQHPIRTVGPTQTPDIDGKTVVLVDDVLFSGRTIRAALDAINDIGRPAAVRLAVLVDRGHRQLPIRPDFVGKNLPTSRSERVQVHVNAIDDDDAVYISKAEQ